MPVIDELQNSFFSNILAIASLYRSPERKGRNQITFGLKEKKEEIWRSPMTKAPTPTEKIKKATWQHKNATKIFAFTTIADLLRTVSWGSDSHPADVIKPVYGIQWSTFPLTTKAV